MKPLTEPNADYRPRKYYSVWTDNVAVESIGSIPLLERVTVYIQLSTEPPPVLNVARGRIVAVVRRGLRKGSHDLNLWLSYAERCCRAWQALRDVADRAGLRYDTPPGILADRADELGYGLELATIRDLYDLPGGRKTLSGAGGIMPPIPDDEGNDLGLIQGEGVGT